jgi:opacity protein-like surface antigen
MRSTSRLVLAVALALSAPALAHAQRSMALESPRTIRFGVGGGISVPTGDFEEVYDQGYNAQAFLLIRPPGLPLSFRVTGTYNRFDQSPEVTSGFERDGYSQIAGALGNVTLHLPLGPVSPYVIAGLGALNFKSVVETASGDVDQSKTEFAINGGAGLAFRVFGADAFLEGRVANVYTDEGFIDTKSIAYVPVTFGIIF